MLAISCASASPPAGKVRDQRPPVAIRALSSPSKMMPAAVSLSAVRSSNQHATKSPSCGCSAAMASRRWRRASWRARKRSLRAALRSAGKVSW